MTPPSSSTCPVCGTPLDPETSSCPRCLMLAAMESTAHSGDATRMPPPALDAVAAAFPQLEVLELIGQGGMGCVYKARQKSLNRPVALKLLAPERAGDPQFAARFEKEAHALAALNHPHIVGVHDFGQAGGFFYLLMEFVDGVNLRQAMKAGRFTPEQALAIVPPVCEALQFAHEHGIVHRDIKPENLLLDKDGRVKIADFGIAKIMGAEASGVGLSESQPAGTPQYMAPEQKEHRATDHRADIYSLGVVLYEMLTGELPADKLQPPSRKVQIDVRLDEIVLRALEKTPELRYATAADFRTQVEAMASPSRTTPPPPKPLVPSKYIRLLPLIPLLLLAVLFVKFIAEARSPSGVTSFQVKPVEVRDNVVLVDVTTTVARGNAELRSMLNGPRLPISPDAASFAPFAVVLIQPTPNDGNPAWRTLSPGTQLWRIAFALPDAALAQAAFANIRPIGPLPAKSDINFAGTLFEVSGPGGDKYRASLEVGRPISSGDPRWVEVIGASQKDASTVTLSWEVSASRPGLAQFSRAGSPIMVLKRQPQSDLHTVTAGFELTRLDADRVLFVRHIGYHILREELPGNFRALADELLRTATTSAKTTCGTTIELCQFQGKPFTVQVQTQGGPATASALVGWTGASIFLLLAGLVGIALFAAFFAWRSFSRDSDQTAKPIQMPQPGQK